MPYKLVIKSGCVDCGCCSHILPSWPHDYWSSGLHLGKWAYFENEEAIDKVIASCPLDKIELVII